MEEITIVYSDVYNVIENSEAHEPPPTRKYVFYSEEKTRRRPLTLLSASDCLASVKPPNYCCYIATDILGYTYRVPPQL